jgi:hypothetical protein
MTLPPYPTTVAGRGKLAVYKEKGKWQDILVQYAGFAGRNRKN